ncbi:ABC-type transport system extracellular binding protein (probable substrate zinc) [Halobacillus halophilus DSM 2266]|uniref:ABC-type transport system extracellular binding protein (Probable substrate zinc) n=1 Tax=Halobacillus halophilus (strain ATCC 35676 / DSM 2266 / JCM 20832 / KCTC 3685 / LMG 17431 / NBRC 102448 / NCIMB 2269) TaxID=866895 RepID=I0JJ99_HALH3|nr:zinc ABC transporter substrate-binding protein [Halobacillus halophilus]CCG44217.1 ABC-type transport system extracellular binding protein (probable substrate zinc) [Halobacillus halophilus DSM 2266]
MKKLAIILFITILTFAMAACSEDTSSQEDDASGENKESALQIHTTVYPLQYFTEQIAGDAVEVETILPPGTDPHTYEPTTKEMVNMAEADAFIYNGAGLEGYAQKISDSLKPEDVKVLEAAKGIDLEEQGHTHGEDSTEAEHSDEHAHEDEDHADEEDSTSHEGEEQSDHEGHDHGENDPHVWLDPIRSIQLAENIKEMLIELKPEKEEQFNQNFEKLKQKLTDLDHQFHEQLENKPKNEIIVSHAAYGYWEQAYGIEQIAVSGLSPSNEPSQKELENIIETAEAHDLNHVLFEQNVTPKVAEVVQSEIGAEPLRIHNLSVLTEEDIQDDENYISLMKQNLEKLNQALSE